MIYSFPVPEITDTKDIKKWFAKKDKITAENYKLLDQSVAQRAVFKDVRKQLKKYKTSDQIPNKTIEELNYYADHVGDLVT